MFVDPGPDLEFEKLVGTKAIVEKYQKLLHKEEPPQSDSSDEPYQFNVPRSKEERIAAAKLEEQRLIAARKKLTSNDRINNYKNRYRGAGAVFRVATNRQSKVLEKLASFDSDDQKPTPQASRYNASSDIAKKKKSDDKSVPESFRKSVEIGSDEKEQLTQTSVSIPESKEEEDDAAEQYTQE